MIVILLSNFHHIKAVNTAAEIWISFKAGKTRMISLNTITTNLGMTTCKAMALFHAFTCTAYQFKVQVQGQAILLQVDAESAIPHGGICSHRRHSIPNITKDEKNGGKICWLYSNDSNEEIYVNLLRMRLFSQKPRDVERFPPTSDALDQHLKRSVFQASIWTTACVYVYICVLCKYIV